MGLFDYWVNTVQADQIEDLQKEVKQLREEMNAAAKWIVYLNKQLVKQQMSAAGDMMSDKGYSEGSFDHPDFKEIQARHHALYGAKE